jgi:uncharacterized protein (DUF736 family)
MIIGIFRRADDGFIGQLFFMGLEHVPIAVIPSKTEKAFALLIAGKDLNTSIEIGKAVPKNGQTGEYLDVKIDGPVLPEPVTATMRLKPSREGIYSLHWTRSARRKNTAG